MQSWIVDRPAPIDEGPLRRVERREPEPGPGQIRVRVSCCGVCRTDLHLAEGDLAPKRAGVTRATRSSAGSRPSAPASTRFAIGDRVGVPWLAGTDGTCRFCRRGQENLCVAPRSPAGIVDGGYADYCVADEGYAYRLPDALDDEHAAPLLCAGIIGYRALRCADVPPGGRLGIYGFGGSAHLTAQIALHQGLRVHVLTRGEHNQRWPASSASTPSAGRPTRRPNHWTARSCSLPPASWCPSRCARWTAGARWRSPGSGCPTYRRCNYAAELFQERRLRSVTANTRSDGEEFLSLAGRFAIRATTVAYPMAQAAAALADLAHGRFGGAAVLHN